MSTGPPQIVVIPWTNEKDDGEDLDDVDLGDIEFWKGLGIPMFCALIGFFYAAIINGITGRPLDYFGRPLNYFFGGYDGMLHLCSICCLWPLLGVSLVFDGKRNEKKNMVWGAWISLILNFIVVILLMWWFYSTFSIF